MDNASVLEKDCECHSRNLGRKVLETYCLRTYQGSAICIINKYFICYWKMLSVHFQHKCPEVGKQKGFFF